MAASILDRWAPILAGIELKTGSGGRFEVSVDGQAVFSKAALKRLPEPSEVESTLEERLGPALDWK